MTRSLMTAIGLLGLVVAAYLVLIYRPATGGLTPAYDGLLFGIAIGLVSVLLIAAARGDREPDAGATG